MTKNDMNDILEIIVTIVTVIAILFFLPFISFFFAWLGGWITKITIGPILCKALNTLFNTTIFTADKIPMISGALGWIGGFFKASSLGQKNKK